MAVPGSWRYVFCALVFVLVVSLSGCIAHQGQNGGGGGGQSTTVTVTSTSTSVGTGGTDNFTATVTGPQDTAVTWNVNNVQNGNATVGTITPGTCGTTLCAVYNAPASVPNPATVSVTAVSVADGTTSSAVTVTITASSVKVTVTPASANVDAGATANFTATVTGSTNVGVTWSVNGNPNGNSTVGTITATSTATGSSATYTAPATAPSQSQNITITAQAQADSNASASATATIPPIVVTLSPISTVQIPVGGTQTFTASVTGATDTSVTNWQVNSIPNGNSVYGTIQGVTGNTALYTAPAIVCAMPCPITITAVSSSDSTSSGSVQGNVHVIVTVSPAQDTIGQGANLQLTSTVTGAPSGATTSVDWSVSCASCTGQQTGGIVDPNNPGLYIAPGLQSGINSIQASVNATSAFDPQQFGTALMTVAKNDPLGTATPSTAAAAQITCPAFTGGVSGATCYKLNVACDGVVNWNAYLKVNTPGTPTGTVILGTGEGGSSLYDNSPDFIASGFNGGDMVVQSLLAPAAGPSFTTVQVSFGAPFDNSASVANGWMQGPGGVRRLACRYATVADWVYKNIHNLSTTAPYCATGNGGGAGAIGYAVSEYALAPEFSMIELTGGPVMTLLHQGCNVCGQYQGADPCPGASPQNMCFTTSGTADGSSGAIDTAYQAVGQTTPTLCTNGVNADNTQFSRFLSDSILDDPGVSPALPIPYPPTYVNVLFGLSDSTNAVPQGFAWRNGVGPTPPVPACAASTPQAVPSTSEGSAQIVTDIQAHCALQ